MKEKRIGPKQYAFLEELIRRDDWVYLNDLRVKLDTQLSRNHKYYMAKDYEQRGFLQRRYERDSYNRPITLVRITNLGRLWFQYHRLGLIYDAQGMFTPRQQAEYTTVHTILKENGFVFQRESPKVEPVVRTKQYFKQKQRKVEGQQLALF